MANFQRYPEIVLLPRRPEIMAVKEVVATEKLHGSNFRIGFPLGMINLGEICYGSREVDYEPGTSFPLRNAVDWFKSRIFLVQRMWEVLQSYGFNDVTVFGEAFGPGIKAKGVRYSDGQEMFFRAFDIMVGENFLTYDLFCEVVDKMGLPRVPEVWRGEPSVEAFDKLLNQPSTVARVNGIDDATNLAEGVVIRSNPLLRNVFGEWLIAKHKGTKFSEVAHAPVVKKEREATPADAYIAKYVTMSRVRNAAERLLDRGIALKNTMVDMPVILTEVIADLHKEAESDWPPNVPDKQMVNAASRVVGPLYKELISWLVA